jgi:hypothetical protein
MKMIIKRILKSVTATGTTATMTFDPIVGIIHKIEVLNGTGSCGWWLYVDSNNQGNIQDEDILGATGAGHVDTAGAIYYPVKAQVLNTGAVTDPDQYSPYIVGGSIVVDVDDTAEGEVLTVAIWYEPANGVY